LETSKDKTESRKLAEEGRFVEAGAIAENLQQVTGIRLTKEVDVSKDTIHFTMEFVLSDGTKIEQFSGVELAQFQDVFIDITEGDEFEFLGYLRPQERFDEGDTIREAFNSN
jgi:hypothetical protein